MNMKKSTATLLYGFIGFLTGIALSFLVCGVCNAAAGPIIPGRPPFRDPPFGAVIGSFAAELIAPFAGMIAGAVLARYRHREPRSLPPESDNPYRQPD
jgi:hypothetical protein